MFLEEHDQRKYLTFGAATGPICISTARHTAESSQQPQAPCLTMTAYLPSLPVGLCSRLQRFSVPNFIAGPQDPIQSPLYIGHPFLDATDSANIQESKTCVPDFQFPVCHGSLELITPILKTRKKLSRLKISSSP